MGTTGAGRAVQRSRIAPTRSPAWGRSTPLPPILHSTSRAKNLIIEYQLHRDRPHLDFNRCLQHRRCRRGDRAVQQRGMGKGRRTRHREEPVRLFPLLRARLSAHALGIPEEIREASRNAHFGIGACLPRPRPESGHPGAFLHGGATRGPPDAPRRRVAAVLQPQGCAAHRRSAGAARPEGRGQARGDAQSACRDQCPLRRAVLRVRPSACRLHAAGEQRIVRPATRGRAVGSIAMAGGGLAGPAGG